MKQALRLTLVFAVAHALQPKLFEGDMVPVYNQILESYGPHVVEDLVVRGVLNQQQQQQQQSNATHNKHDSKNWFYLWPERSMDNRGKIPYAFDSTFRGDTSIVVQAMKDIEQQSGVVRFVPITTKTPSNGAGQEPYVLITGREREDNYDVPGYLEGSPNCWSHVGRQQTAVQEVNLADGCVDVGIVQHMLLHTLGFWHPNSRYDRDDYIGIAWDHVYPGGEFNFQERIHDDTLGQPYDYASIMHCWPRDFSDGQADVLIAPEPIGQIDGLSDGDVVQLRLYYQCESGPRTLAEYTANPCTAKCKCWEQAPFACHGSDEVCQAGLVCDSSMDQCVMPAVGGGESWMSPKALIASVMLVGFCSAMILCGKLDQLDRKHRYESL